MTGGMKLGLIGVGLIGGSLAAAWRAAGAVTSVSGYDIDPSALTKARSLGIIDRVAQDVADAVADAEVVVLAVPVGRMAAVLTDVAAAVPATAVITDVGSTKGDVIAAAHAALGTGSSFGRFVPGHPIAGRELPGVEHADAKLFNGKLVILTPTEQTQPEAVATIERAWSATGARVERMDAAEHDRVFAAVSHLPHLLSFALVAAIAAAPDGERKFGFAGAGFRDFTRIAASSPVMWRDIALANRSALGTELRTYRALLEQLQAAIDNGDAATVERVFDVASRARRRHGKTFDAE